MISHNRIHRSVKVREKFPKFGLKAIGLPKTAVHIFKIGSRFIRPEMMKCLHFGVSFLVSKIMATESNNSTHIIRQIRILNGAVSLVKGKYASLCLKQNPNDACRYGLLPENICDRSCDNTYPPIVKFTSPLKSFEFGLWNFFKQKVLIITKYFFVFFFKVEKWSNSLEYIPTAYFL